MRRSPVSNNEPTLRSSREGGRKKERGKEEEKRKSNAVRKTRNSKSFLFVSRNTLYRIHVSVIKGISLDNSGFDGILNRARTIEIEDARIGVKKGREGEAKSISRRVEMYVRTKRDQCRRGRHETAD